MVRLRPIRCQLDRTCENQLQSHPLSNSQQPSPSDVADERALAAQVIERLNGLHHDQVILEAVLWEQRVYDANRSFQDQITAMQEMDLVVGILWKRVGSELPPERFQREDGSAYESGTVFELEAALACDGDMPVYVFKKTAPVFYSKETVDDERHQADLLDAWWDRTFHDAERHFLRGFEPFSSPEAFDQRLTVAINDWLDTTGLVPKGPIWDMAKDTPYPGLRAYDSNRAGVFFGRDLAIGEAIGLLLQNINREYRRPVLLIIGASGSGKSSLARAGIVPRLIAPGIVSGIDKWQTVLVEPTGDALGELASRLYEALPELSGSPQATPEEWVALVVKEPATAGQSVRWALKQTNLAQQTKQLILVLDQLETLIDDTARDAFALAIRSLVEQAGVWLVATLRSDHYASLQNQPVLLALKRSGVVYDLPPPGKAEIGEIVRGPTWAAGLLLEEKETRSLAAELAAATPSADALPLLQMSLSRLFDERRENLLTLDAFDAMGGVEGAIAAHAQGVFARLGQKARHELPSLIEELTRDVTCRADGTITFTARVANGRVFESTPARRKLVKAFVEDRLLVRGHGQNFRIAHEAILRHWQDGKECLDAIAQAELRKARRHQAMFSFAALIFLVGAAAAAYLYSTAKEQTRLAEQQAAIADSRRLAAQADAILERYPQRAGLLAVEAIKTNKDNGVIPEAEQALGNVVNSIPGIGLGGHTNGMIALTIDPRGRWLVTRGNDGTVRLWDLSAEELARPLSGHDAKITSVVVDSQGRWLVTGSNDTVRLWDLTADDPSQNGRVLHGDKSSTGTTVKISPQGRWLVTGGNDDTVRLWDLSADDPTQFPRILRGYEHSKKTTAIGPQGRWLATSGEDNTVRLWDLNFDDPSQSGKTTFFKGFCRRLEKTPFYVPILLSFQDYKNLSGQRFYQLIQKSIYRQLISRIEHLG